MKARIYSLLAGICFLLSVSYTVAQEAPAFRTDETPVADKTLKWYELKEGKFPPAGSAHVITGELIYVDHLERRFHLRVDRNDSQQGDLDQPIVATMLPYGSIYYHGAPAALQDIPLGTHLHGMFYRKDPNDKSPPLLASHRRVSSEAPFSRCFQLEDDFTFYSRQSQAWKIDSVNVPERKLTATLHQDGKAVGQPKLFDLRNSTRVRVGTGYGNLEALQPGQLVQFNITWATLYGPGRLLEIWLDEPSRKLATELQLERHRDEVRDHGLPGWIDAVDDDAQIVTITFFGGVDPKLFNELTGINPEPYGWPHSKPEDNPLAPKGSIAVALDSLMTYDPVNDRKGSNILKIDKVAIEPGSSGVQVQLKCDMLLEGFRPKRIVRFYPGPWKVVALPREEQYHGRE